MLRRSKTNLLRIRRPSRSSPQNTEQIMRFSSLLRTATLALSLTAVTGAMTAAFAADATAAQQQQQQSASPYDNQDFVLQNNNIHN
jgi:hypothetical protein